MGSDPGAAAAPDFPKDDSETNGVFGQPVGGLSARHFQEREQIVDVVPEVLGQSFVGGVGLGRPDQIGQLVVQSAGRDGETMSTDVAGREAIAQS